MDTKARHVIRSTRLLVWLNYTSKNIKTNTGLERKRLLVLHGVVLRSEQMFHAVAVGAYCITSLSNSFSCRKTKRRGNSSTPGKTSDHRNSCALHGVFRNSITQFLPCLFTSALLHDYNRMCVKG